MKTGDLVLTYSNHQAIITEVVGNDYAWFWWIPCKNNGMNNSDFSFRGLNCIKSIISTAN